MHQTGCRQGDVHCRKQRADEVTRYPQHVEGEHQGAEPVLRRLTSRLSYRLQTPLSTIQTAVETLADGDMIPAQAQRSRLDLGLSELKPSPPFYPLLIS